jgi:hypothetical protein
MAARIEDLVSERIVTENEDSLTESAAPSRFIAWREWQAEVVATVRTEFPELFPNLTEDDFDWTTWRPLYDKGCQPTHAVRQALSLNRTN